MSKFNDYGKKVNDIAKAAFDEYRKAEAAYKKAEEQARQYPPRHGVVDAQYAAKSARAQAEFLEAKENMRKAKAEFSSHNSEIAALRKQLAADLDKHFQADPAALDGPTMELLKSGILKSSEYAGLMKQATDAGNYTMARMIAQYAKNTAAARGKEFGENDAQARELRAVSYMAGAINGSNTLAAFDLMADVYNRATNNPGMIDHWEQLTSEAAENM